MDCEFRVGNVCEFSGSLVCAFDDGDIYRRHKTMVDVAQVGLRVKSLSIVVFRSSNSAFLKSTIDL